MTQGTRCRRPIDVVSKRNDWIFWRFLNFFKNNDSLERKFPKRVRQQQHLGAFRRQCPKREELPPRQLQPDEQQQLREADGRQLRLEVGRIDAAGACVKAQQIISRLVRPK